MYPSDNPPSNTGTHDEGRLVLALCVVTGLFLSFGEPLSYGKLLLRGLSIGSFNDRGITQPNIAYVSVSTY